MKVVLGLALMCCFIGGIVGCNCGRLKDCFCLDNNEHVVKAVVDSDPDDYPNFRQYSLRERTVFKGTDDFQFVRVPKSPNCPTLQKDEVYIFMGKKAAPASTLRTPVNTGKIKKWNNVKPDQRKFLRQCDRQNSYCPKVNPNWSPC